MRKKKINHKIQKENQTASQSSDKSKELSLEDLDLVSGGALAFKRPKKKTSEDEDD